LRHLMRSIEGSFNDDASIYCSGLDNDIGIESYRKIRTGILHKNEKN
jgi:hypothetical protein